MGKKTLTLDEIAIECGTDKSSKCHGFASFYDKHLFTRKDDGVKILEIGVKNGDSLNMWARYFVNGEVHGADIRPERAARVDEGIFVHHVDQGDVESLESLFEVVGMVDVLIDDGSHKMSHQQNTLDVGMEYINDGGVFIMEDLHTSMPEYKSPYWDVTPTTMEVLREMQQDYRIDFYESPTKGWDSTSMTAIIYKP